MRHDHNDRRGHDINIDLDWLPQTVFWWLLSQGVACSRRCMHWVPSLWQNFSDEMWLLVETLAWSTHTPTSHGMFGCPFTCCRGALINFGFVDRIPCNLRNKRVICQQEASHQEPHQPTSSCGPLTISVFVYLDFINYIKSWGATVVTKKWTPWKALSTQTENHAETLLL